MKVPFRLTAFLPTALQFWICVGFFSVIEIAQAHNDSIEITQIDIGETRRQVEQAVFDEQRNNLAVISFAGDYDRTLPEGEFNLDARLAVARSFYTSFADDYDFLVVFTTFEFDTGNALAFFHPVRNSIEGIGRNIFDNGFLYDSPDRLQGYIDMAAHTRYELDPTAPAYRNVLSTLSHEVMHRWFSGIEYLDNEGNISTDLLGLDGDHWPVFSDSQASVMGGAIWRENGDGTHTALDSFRQYSDFDLYLAGFLPADSGLSHDLIHANGETERLFPALDETVAGERERITLDQLIAANGPRIPAFEQAQREFQIGFVLLKRPGESVPESLFQSIATVQKDFPQRFSAQTGGLGIALTHLPEAGTGVIGVPDTVIDISGQTAAFDVDRAADWLITQQVTEGFWQDKSATRVRDTSLAARFIGNARPASNAWVNGRDWLATRIAVSSDDRVWQLASALLPGDVNSQLIGDLIARQMPDGGWGLQDRYQSSPLDTAQVLLTVGGALPNEVSQQANSYLLSLQNVNGSWSPVNGGASELLTTASAVSALKLQNSNMQAVDAAVQWLRSQQRSNGGYGSDISTIATTVAVLRAFTGLLPSSDPSIQNAIDFLSSRQHVDGHWEFSVHSTAQAADFLSSQGRPNLLWQTFSIQPAPAVTGQPVQVDTVVSNNGVVDAPATTAILVDTTSGLDEIVAGPIQIDALAAGSSRELSFLFDTGGISGARQLLLRLDPDLLIAEVNELDNETMVQIDIIPALAGVDAAVFGAELDLDPETIGSLPTNVQVSIIVRNLGDQAASNLALAVLDNRSSGPVELQRTVLDMPPVGAEQVTFLLELQTRPANSFSIVVDPDNVLTEVNEGNNEIEFNIPFIDGVDFVATSADITIDPLPAVAGSDNVLQVSFRNSGTSDAPPANAQVLEHFDGQIRVLLDTTTQLQAGGSDVRTIAWRPVQTGDHQIEILLDQDNAIAEADESNNSVNVNVAVVAASTGNLSIESWQAIPDPALEGAGVDLQATIRNGGAAINADISYSIYSGDPQQGGELLESNQILGGLGSGAATSISFTTAPLSGAANRIFVLQLDPADQISESDESDNQTFIEISVLSLPDLLVTPAAVSLSPAAPVPGQPVTATINVSNLGQQPSGTFAITVEDAEASGDFSLVAAPVSASDIPGGASAAVQVTWNWPEDLNVTRLRIAVDSGDEVSESDETNNIITRAVTTQPGDLYLTELFISPDGNGVQDTTSITFNLTAPDNLSVQIVDPAGDVVRILGPFIQTTQASVIWDGRDNDGRVVDDEDYSVRLIGSSGIRAINTVTVDTNRYPIYRAIGTPREHIELLGCEIESNSNSQVNFSIDGERLLISNPEDPFNGDNFRGIFSIPTLGRGVQNVVSEQWLENLADQDGFDQRISEFHVLANGDILFVTSRITSASNRRQRIWIQNPLSGLTRELNYASLKFTNIIDVIDETIVLVRTTQSNPSIVRYMLVDINGINPAQEVDTPELSLYYLGASRDGFLLTEKHKSDPDPSDPYVSDETGIWFIPYDPGQVYQELDSQSGVDTEYIDLSDNGRYLAVIETINGPDTSGAGVYIYDLHNPSLSAVFFDASDVGNASDLTMQWSPAANRLYIINRLNGRIHQYDQEGNLLRDYDMPDLSVFDDIISQFNGSFVPEGGIAIGQPGAGCSADASYKVAMNDDLRPPVYKGFKSVIELSPLLFSPDGSDALLAVNAIDEAPIEGCLKVSLAAAMYQLSSDDDELAYMPELRTDFYSVCTAFDQNCLSGVELQSENINTSTWLLPSDGVIELFDNETSAGIDHLIAQLNPQIFTTTSNEFEVNDVYPRVSGLAAKQLSYRGAVPIEREECGPLTGYQNWSSRSLDNAVAHLETKFENGLFILTGIAADRHLDNYQLEWASTETPNQRNVLLSPQSTEVIDEFMAFWAPPQPGIYNIFLTVTDLAGNQSMDVVSVSSSELPSISSISGSPNYISPNGDNIQDEYKIQFRVFQSLMVNIEITDSTGMLVRTISQDIVSPTGELLFLSWDGRDDSGNIVPDGNYSVSVNGNILRMTVDTLPPEITGSFINHNINNVIGPNGPSINPASLRSRITDTSGGNYSFEMRILGDAGWLQVDDGVFPCIVRNNEVPCRSNSFPAEFTVDSQFRVSALDKAGNQVHEIIQPDAPSLSLTGSAYLSADNSDDFGLDQVQFTSFNETPSAPDTALYATSSSAIRADTITMEFSIGDDDWFSLPVDQQDHLAQEAGRWGFEHPSGDDPFWGLHHVLIWNQVNYPEFAAYSIRLHAVTDTGQEVLSNEVNFGNVLNSDVVGEISPVRIWAQSLLDLARSSLPAKPPDTIRLWLSGFSENEPAENITLSVTSNDDPRYLAPVQFAPVVIEENVVDTTHRFVAVFEVPITCLTSYSGGYAASVQLFNGDNAVVSLNRSFSDSCSFKALVGPNASTSCDASPLNSVTIVTQFAPSDNASLDAIVIERELFGGGSDVLLSDTNPDSIDNLYELDTSTLPIGQHSLLINAVLDNGGVITERVTLLVQDQLPNFDISFPQPGARLCLSSEIIDIETSELVLPVEGFINGTQPYTYRLSLQNDGSDQLFGLRTNDGGPSFRTEPEGSAVPGRSLNPELDKKCDPVIDDPTIINKCLLTVRQSGSKQGVLGKVRRDLASLPETGQFKIVMTATSWNGALACDIQPFTLDSGVDAGSVVATHNIISPNADGAFDVTIIQLFASEPLLIDARIFNAQRADNGTFEPVGSALETLFDSRPASGEFQFAWDGIGTQGAYEDGDYIVQLTLLDDCGIQRIDNVHIVVDNTGPEVSVDFPHAGSDLTTIIEVLGTVSDPHFDRYRLAFREAGSDATGTTLATGEQDVINNFLGFWNLSGLLGSYELLLSAVDEVNNASETSVVIDINELGSLIFALDAQPRQFSPDGNGVLDSTVATLGLISDADIDISVLNSTGTSVLQLLSNNLSAGSHQILWHGHNNSGSVVPDGQYDIIVNASNGGLFQQEQVSVVVDNTPPLIQILNPPGAFSDGTGALSVLFDDIGFNTYQIYRSPQPGSPASQLVMQGDVAGTVDALSLAELSEGVYDISVQASDQAGNVSEVEQTITIDRTLPQADLLSPGNDSFLSVLAGPVSILGQLSDQNFTAYTIDIRAAGSTDPWLNLHNSDTLPDTDLLFEWDLNVPDGAYELRLRVTDLAANARTDTVTVTVDNTAPQLALTAPELGAVIGPDTQVIGQASDANLRRYRVSLSPVLSNPPLWSDFISGDQSVEDGILGTFTALPADGNYQLQLLAEDLANNSAEEILQTVIVDGTAPATPQNLSAEVMQGGVVSLAWSAVSDADLAAYRVFRDGAMIATVASSSTSFTDSGAADGEHSYQVAAMDIVGNQSLLSNAVAVQIDTTPPTVILLAPESGSRHRGNVAVRASAYGDDDLASYQLYLAADGQALPGDLLIESGVAVNASVIYTLDTTTLISESVYTLTLIAADLTANQAQVMTQILVDNTPPAAPSGLQGSLDQAPAQDTAILTWTPNTESDLLGYLLLRNGELVNGPAASDDLRPLALADSNFVDMGLPDGEHIYAVLAIDTAGNVSAPSAAVSVVVEQGPPELQLLRPDDGTQFDGPLPIAAGSADLDIAEVIFEYRPAAGGDWIMIGDIDTLAPFEATLDPTGLDRGFYQIRGLATDQGGLSDPTPPVVTVEHRDLNPPPAVAQVSAQVTGSEVVLNWAAVSADDLAGYHIDRTQDATTVRITASALTTTNVTDTGLADGVYSYQVIAVDDSDNESSPSVAVSAQVTTPRLDVRAPLETDTSITVTGFAEVQGNAELTVQPSGYIDTQAIMDDGAFSFSNVPLNAGDNQLEVLVNYASNNVSNTATAVITQAQPPSAPTGLQAEVNNQQITLSWNPNPEPDIAGYQVFSGTNPLIQPALISGIIADATVNTASASNSIDGDFNTFWQVPGDSLLGGAAQSIRFVLPQPEIVNDLTLFWQRAFTAALPPQHFQIQAMFNGVWQTLAELDSNGLGSHTVSFEQAIRTDQIRVVMFGPPQLLNVVRLYEASLRRVGLTDATSFDVGTMPNGSFEFTLTGRNEIGLESEPSAPVTATVGDFTAPAPVTLAAQVIDSDVQLSWNTSQAADLSHYQLYRDAEPIAMVNPPETLYVDSNLAGGEYGYTVTVVDLAGNESEASNTVTVTIQADAPEPPSNLIVIAPSSGDMLELSWTASPSVNVVRYNISRSLQSGGPYALQNTVAAPQTSYQDTSVIPGQTYYYVVQAADAPGNLSAYSNEASATPVDSVAPQPPVINQPTSAGEPIEVATPSVAVAGTAEPGVRVNLKNNSQLVGTAQTSVDFTAKETALAAFIDEGGGLLSPDGRWLFVRGFPDDRLVNLEGGADISLPTQFGLGQWSEDAQTFFVRSDDRTEVLALEISSQQVVSLYSAVEINAFAVSADRNMLFVSGIHDTGTGMTEGLWVTELNTGVMTLFADMGRFFVNRDTVRWSPNAQYIGFTYTEFGNELYVVNTLGELQTSVPLGSGSGSIPEWRPGGDGLLALARNDMFRKQVVFLAEPFATAMPETLSTQSDVNYAMPSWSPDGNALVWQRQDFIGEDGSVQIIDIFDFTQREVASSVTTEQFQFLALRWLNNGSIRGLDTSSRLDIVQPGGFVIEQVALGVGSNELTATAIDDVGNQSFDSAPINVTYLPQNLPDLVLDTLSVLPITANPEQSVNINLSISNQGSVDADGQFGVRLVDSFNNTISQLAISSLGNVTAGGLISGGVTLTAPNDAGAYRVIATVDPDNQLSELDESNNIAVVNLSVIDDGPPALMIDLSQNTRITGSVLSGMASVFNPGNSIDVRLLLSITDSDGALVATLPMIEINDLLFGESRMIPFDWDSMQTFAGDYLLRAQLTDSAGVLLAEQIAAFTLIDDVQIQVDVNTDQLQYETGQTVLITTDIDYAQGNTPIDGAQLRLRAFASDNVEVFSKVVMPGRLLPGDQVEIIESWQLDGVLAGEYSISSGLFIEGSEADTAQAMIGVIPASINQVLSGTVTLATPSVAHGNPIQTSYAISNIGDVPVQGDLILALAAIGQSGVIEQQMLPLDLAPAGILSGDLDFTTTNLLPGAYSIRLSVQLGTDTSLLDVANLNVIDAGAPAITILAPAQDAVIGSDVLFRVSANDSVSAIDSVSISVDTDAPRNMIPGVNGEYSSNFVLADGNHLFTVTATDSAGNSASADGAFVVDSISPDISITGVSDGLLTNQPPVTPVIVIMDDHLQTSSILLNNQTYVSATPITADGDYVLLASALDAAGNSNSATRTFTIDTFGPDVLLISPEADTVVTTTEVNIEVLSEANVMVSLQNGAGDSFEQTTNAAGSAIFTAIPLVSGANSISMQGTDPAGNVGATNNFILTLDADPVAAVNGSLTLADPEPAIPRPLGIRYAIVNTGNVPFTDLPIRISLKNNATQIIESVYTMQTALAVNETISNTLLFATEGLNPDNYSMLLEAEIEPGVMAEIASIQFTLGFDHAIIFMDGFEDLVELTKSSVQVTTPKSAVTYAAPVVTATCIAVANHGLRALSGYHDYLEAGGYLDQYPKARSWLYGGCR